MPRDGFAFAVFIGCEPDFVGGFGGLSKVGNNTFMTGVNFVGDVKSILVDFSVFADVSNGSKDLEV